MSFVSYLPILYALIKNNFTQPAVLKLMTKTNPAVYVVITVILQIKSINF